MVVIPNSKVVLVGASKAFTATAKYHLIGIGLFGRKKFKFINQQSINLRGYGQGVR